MAAIDAEAAQNTSTLEIMRLIIFWQTHRVISLLLFYLQIFFYNLQCTNLLNKWTMDNIAVGLISVFALHPQIFAIHVWICHHAHIRIHKMRISCRCALQNYTRLHLTNAKNTTVTLMDVIFFFYLHSSAGSKLCNHESEGTFPLQTRILMYNIHWKIVMVIISKITSKSILSVTDGGFTVKQSTVVNLHICLNLVIPNGFLCVGAYYILSCWKLHNSNSVFLNHQLNISQQYS